jgi:hypothetical protein
MRACARYPRCATFSDRCVNTLSGHVIAAPPTAVMNSRRLIGELLNHISRTLNRLKRRGRRVASQLQWPCHLDRAYLSWPSLTAISRSFHDRSAPLVRHSHPSLTGYRTSGSAPLRASHRLESGQCSDKTCFARGHAIARSRNNAVDSRRSDSRIRRLRKEDDPCQFTKLKAIVARTQLVIIFDVAPDYCPKTTICTPLERVKAGRPHNLTLSARRSLVSVGDYVWREDSPRKGDTRHEASLRHSRRAERHRVRIRSIRRNG